ncbi:glycosyltransferase family protein [Desulfonatronum parangueonense]
MKSLPDGPEQYRLLREGGEYGVLLLGLGPNPRIPLQIIAGRSDDVLYLEAPEFLDQLPVSRKSEIPSHWRPISSEALADEKIRNRAILFYQPNLHLFPDFWAPAVAFLRHGPNMSAPSLRERDTVWMPTSEHGLLARELTQAFANTGLRVRALPEKLLPTELEADLRQSSPELFFSVNFRGLDPYGQNYEFLATCKAPVAVWCVDNPFHLLTGIQSGFWRKCILFVTDDWFIPRLRELGAQHVVHLPLAAAPNFFEPAVEAATLNGQPYPGQNASGTANLILPDGSLASRTIFVGRSSFPGKNAFFAGCSVAPDLRQQVSNEISRGSRPDFSWWWDRLRNPPLWPGRAVRNVGYAAEESSQMHRTVHLQAVNLEARLTVFGDQDWHALLPDLKDIRPGVDYYGPLPRIYRQARCTLNLTSLLLPHGLTQRHFDVWAADGFLLSDATPGLSIFDQELVREISFNSPKNLVALLTRLDLDSRLADHLRHDWKKLILDAHTYDHRIETIMQAVSKFGIQPN